MSSHGSGPDIKQTLGAITNMASDLLDTLVKVTVLGKFTDAKEGFLRTGFDLADKILDMRTVGPYLPPNTFVYAELDQELKDLGDALKGGLVGGLGASLAQYTEGLYRTETLIKAYKDLKFNVGVLPFVTRQYLAEFYPNEPDMHLGFKMVQRGNITRGEFNTYLENQGWGSKFLDKIYNSLLTTPQPFEAFSWFRRGIITQDTLNTWLKAYGIFDGDLTYWNRGLYRAPSLGELTRISDFVELSAVYLGQALRGAGYPEEEVTLMTTALQKRPNREEVRGMTTELIWMYQHGRMSSTELSSAFDDLDLLPTEKALDTERAELQYGQQLIQEALQVIEYRVYKKDPAVLTISTIKTAVMAIGINEETSNLLAEQFYYHYIYAPP